LNAMSSPRRIEGYAIVSEDGMLADAAGVMPDSLKFEADSASSSGVSTASMWSCTAAIPTSNSRIRRCVAA